MMMPQTMRKFLDSGTLFVWLCGAGLALSLLMISGLMILIMVNGLGYFWPKDLVQLSLTDGSAVLGEVTGHEVIHNSVSTEFPEGKGRVQLKVGNRDLYGLDFRWVDEANIQSRSLPKDVVFLERREWGNFFGRIHSLKRGEEIVVSGNQEATTALLSFVDRANDIHEEIRHLEQGVIGAINYEMEEHRLKLRSLEMQGNPNSPEIKALEEKVAVLQSEYEQEAGKLRSFYDQLGEYNRCFRRR